MKFDDDESRLYALLFVCVAVVLVAATVGLTVYHTAAVLHPPAPATRAG